MQDSEFLTVTGVGQKHARQQARLSGGEDSWHPTIIALSTSLCMAYLKADRLEEARLPT